MRIACPECGHEIPAVDVNVATGVAKCSACDSVFGFLDQVEHAKAASDAPRERPIAPQPKSFEVMETGGELGIRFRWRTPAAYALLAFCLFWDGFLVLWYVIAFGANGPLLMKVFPVLHVAVGIGLSYVVAAMFVNRTTLIFGLGQFQVKHGPVPWPGNCTGSADEIDQLYVTSATRSHNDTTTFVYSLMARMKDGEKRKLVSGLTDVDQSVYLEQTIERFLGIVDRRMPEES